MLEARCFRAPPVWTLHPCGCGWTSPTEGCTHRQALASAPCLTGRKSIFWISGGCWLQTHIHAPVSHHHPSHCQRRWGPSSGPDHQPEPCPLTPGPQPTSCWLSNSRRRSRGWDHVCVPSGFPEHAPGSPAGPLRMQRPWAPCG